MSPRAAKWVGSVVAVVVMTSLVGYFVVVGLDQADKLASVFGVFLGVVGLCLTAYGVLTSRGTRSSSGSASTTVPAESKPIAPVPPKPDVGGSGVGNNISGGVFHAPVIQSGSIESITFTAPPSEPPQAAGGTPVLTSAFELTTSAGRITRWATDIVSVPLGTFAFMVIVGVVLGIVNGISVSIEHIPKILAFAWEVVTKLPMPISLFMAVGVVSGLFRGGSDGHDLLAVGVHGLAVVDKRWVRWQDRSFSLPWKHLARVRVSTEASRAFYHVVVEFKDGQSPAKDWAKRHGVVEEKYSHTIATISVRDAERAAMIPRLKAALAQYGGEVYADDQPREDDSPNEG